MMKNITKRLISLVMASVMMMSLVAHASAVTLNEEQLPPWVLEGEVWHPVDEIMTLEDFGNCPKGHTGPAGYKYQGYTFGYTHVVDNNLASNMIGIASIASAEVPMLSFSLAVLGLGVANMPKFEIGEPIDYWKYIYTKGNSTFIHVVYAYKYNYNGTPEYRYLTCETYYEL